MEESERTRSRRIQQGELTPRPCSRVALLAVCFVLLFHRVSLTLAFGSFTATTVKLSGKKFCHFLPARRRKRGPVLPLFGVGQPSSSSSSSSTSISYATSTTSTAIPSLTPRGGDTTTKTSTTTPRDTRTRRRRPEQQQQQQQRRKRQWDDMIADLRAFRREKGHALVTANDADNPQWADLYVWTKSVRRNYAHQVLDTRPRGRTKTSTAAPRRQQRPKRLAADKIQQLQDLDFCWDVQSSAWEKRYQHLVQFYQHHGHSRVPANYPGGLGIFVRNCRREYRRLEQGEPSTLTVDRLHKLLAVDFVWYKSREEAWDYRYKQLQEFFQQHGHANVPDNYVPNPALGQWCRNQRTYYKRRYRGEMSSLTEERIQLLEDVGFIWNYRRYRFETMLNRLAMYYREHGHVQIATTGAENRDLRFWVTIQRYYYHHRQRDLEKDGTSSVPLTEDRIQAIEAAIPDFHWRARNTNSGPSSQDWAKLFDEMRKKGIRPGMAEKRHWFDGVNPFAVSVKDTWTDDDLMALWNAEDDEDEDDDHDWES